MNAIDLLEQQHRETEDLFDRFEEVSGDRRRELVQQVIRDLRLHTTLEEEIFYPAVGEGLGMKDEIREDLEEHHLVELALDELETMEPDDERVEAKMEVLRELVEHHVDEEEDELFPEVRSRMDEDDLTGIGQRMQERAEELETEFAADDSTKEELYQTARELDIPGRSGMSKRELAGAVRSRR